MLSLLLFLVSFSLLSEYVTGKLSDSFAKYQMNAQNNGICPYEGVTSPSSADWVFDTYQYSGYLIEGSPAIGPNGNIHFTQGQYMYCVSPTGERLWAHKFRGYFQKSTPAIHADGTVYVAATNYDVKRNSFDEAHGYVFAFDSAGNVLWNYEIEDCFQMNNVNVAENGDILVSAGGRYVYCLSPSGELKWKYDGAPGLVVTGSWVKYEMTPAIAVDGTIVMGTADGILHKLSDNGELLWKFDMGTAIPFYSNTAPVIDERGDIYMVVDGGTGYDYNSSVVCLSGDGSLKWSLDMSEHEFRELKSPVVFDGYVYFSADYYVVSVTTEGAFNWKLYFRDPAYGSLEVTGTPVISMQSKMLYVGAFFYIFGYSIANPVEVPVYQSYVFRKQMSTYAVDFSPSMTHDGVLYSAGYSKLYAWSNA